jgi:hypothetical protein
MARYQPDHTGFAQMMNSAMIEDFLEHRGHAAAADLKAIAPHRTGRYAASVTSSTGRDLMTGDRPAVFVIADTDYATALEVGSRTIKNPPRPLHQLLESIKE